MPYIKRMPALIVLEALMNGIPCQIGKFTYVMSVNNKLCVQGKNETTGEDVLLVVNFGDVTIADFINLTEQATDEELIVISANLGLNGLYIEQRQRSERLNPQ